MKIAAAQINAVLGDFSANREKILDFARRAKAEDCDLVVFPEHALFGYLPNDLLERDSIVVDQLKELKKLEAQWPAGILGLVGCVTKVASKSSSRAGTPAESLSKKKYFNSAALFQKSKKTIFFHKERLPSFDVFDETRHLAPGSLKNGHITLKIGRKKLRTQITICEDIWGWGHASNSLAKLPRAGVDLVVNLSASPFTKSKFESRKVVIAATAKHFRAPLLYVNMVGAQDEVIFDGRSLVVAANGSVVAEGLSFQEDLKIFDLETLGSVARAASAKPLKKSMLQKQSAGEMLRQALVLGLRDFVRKTGLGRVHFGLSGGIDSAVVACLAVEALGPEAVTGVALPGPFNSPQSFILARTLAENLSIRFLEMPIEKPYESLQQAFSKGVGPIEFGLVHENLQARIRGVLLMALANKESSLLLSTGNKSELAAGYSTLYGDQCGGLAPLGDLLKREVYGLAEIYNSDSELIPKEIIERAPTAELRPNQKDSDSLPGYDTLDRAVESIIECRQSAKSAAEKFVLKASLASEFKRWQAPPILKISEHAFGRGRRFPIAHRARS